MKLHNNSGKVISKSEAEKFTHTFQSKNPNSNTSYFVGSDKVNKILEQDDCIGIRIYNGLKANTEYHNRVLVGVNSKGEDMVDGVILEELAVCPPFCHKNSSLLK